MKINVKKIILTFRWRQAMLVVADDDVVDVDVFVEWSFRHFASVFHCR